MELWYFIFDVRYYDDYDDNYKKRHERGVICAENKSAVFERLEQWYGKDKIYDVRIYDVDMDTNELLFERNFPGLIDMLENPIE